MTLRHLSPHSVYEKPLRISLRTMKYYYLYILAALACLMSCSDEYSTSDNLSGREKIELMGEIDQVYATRVNDSGFADGDVMGVYVVDYEGSKPGTLLEKGNRADNVMHKYDEQNMKWVPAYEIYWKDRLTHVDIYGYYPYATPDDVNQYQFTVQRDQSTETDANGMGGYEASDFLWAKATDIAPTSSVIRLAMKHRMSTARVKLVEGNGFAEGEWAQTEKQIIMPNLIRQTTINLNDGIVKATGAVESSATIPSRTGDDWRAIVAPQTVAAGTTLFSITIGGVPYKYAKNEELEYVAGRMANFTIRVDKRTSTGQYALTLVGESITDWENDLVSHDATAKEYIIIHTEAGQLKETLEKAGKNHKKVKRMKLTGSINATDFILMRDEMTALTGLNMKHVRLKSGYARNQAGDIDIRCDKDDAIPINAFYRAMHLNYIILPDTLTIIYDNAFYESGITGSLVIPEGVTEVGMHSFDARNLNGSLTLPSTLKKVGPYGFSSTNISCELQLPDGLEYIGDESFKNTRIYGELRLPKELKYLGRESFAYNKSLSGDIVIPQSLTSIGPYAFKQSPFGGNLIMHDGITNIGEYAFEECNLKGELILPKGLTVIHRNVFHTNNFSGELKLPEQLTSICESAFDNNRRLMGELKLPEDMVFLDKYAFKKCPMIEKIILPASLESIGEYAFEFCYGINSIVCRGEIPPRVASNTFDGVSKENFTVEVPEIALAQYKTAPGWCEFKKIAAHHELVCTPSAACALNATHKQTIVVYAEGEWEVESMPDWCTLSQNSGNKKTEVTLTINQMSKGAGNRKGEIVFKLKDKDYRHKCAVRQYDYTYDENQWLTLQKATKGKNDGINLVFIGDGYDAENISTGNYLSDVREQVENFFSIEPYRSYREYFNVYTAFAMSTESGVSTVNTIRYNRFGTTFTGGVGLKCNYNELFDYVLKAPAVTENNLRQSLIVVIPNSTDYGGVCEMWEDGTAIAFCPKSNYDYPFDSRGIIQHEAGGHGFGKLGDESIYHNTFIDACGCSCCGHVKAIEGAKSLGWYDNLSLTGKMNQVPWSHLIFDNRYSDIVDIFEGGFMHARGVYRSEQNSCMNNYIPYYNTISRESIVRRIKNYAGETFDFDDFVRNDSREAGTITRSSGHQSDSHYANRHQLPPRIQKGSPQIKQLKNKR